jgi:hemolysin activation/secretion protein
MMNLGDRSVQPLFYGMVLLMLASLEPQPVQAQPGEYHASQTTSAKDLLPLPIQSQEQSLAEQSSPTTLPVISSSPEQTQKVEVSEEEKDILSPSENQTRLLDELAMKRQSLMVSSAAETVQLSESLTLSGQVSPLEFQTRLIDNLARQPENLPQENLSLVNGDRPTARDISHKIEQYYQQKTLLAQAENPDQENKTPASAPVTIKEVKITGNTAFSTEELSEIVSPFLNQQVEKEKLNDLAQLITQHYLNQGYLNSMAIVKDKNNIGSDGVVTIEIKEGRLGEITIEGTERLQDYIRQRVEMGAGQPLNIKNLEEQLRLLKIDPLFKSVDASLRPPNLGEEQTTENKNNENFTNLFVRVIEAKPLFGQVSLDNYSPPSIGAERLSMSLGYRNPGGLGDTAFVSYRPRLEAITGTYRLDTYYQVPVNPMNGTIAVSTFLDRNKILTDSFTPLNIRGNSDRYVVEYRQPLIRTVNEEFALSFGLSYDYGQTFALDQGVPFGFGPNAQGISESSPLIFGQDYVSRSPEGIWALRSQLRFGTGLFGATSNPSPIPDGYFFAWAVQAQRLQVINDDNFLIAQVDLQLTPNPLLPMEQFAIGGAQSVRGYRQNVLAADNGVRLSLEDRITLIKDKEERPVFILAPFFDIGTVWMASGNPNQIGANNNIIAGLGLGLIYQPISGLNMRVDYAPPLINLNIRGNNIQDDGLYLSIGYDF